MSNITYSRHGHLSDKDAASALLTDALDDIRMVKNGDHPEHALQRAEDGIRRALFKLTKLE